MSSPALNQLHMSPQETLPGQEYAIVEGRCDPLRLGRVRVRIPSIHDASIPSEKLPWAFPNTIAGPQCGLFFIPPLKSVVRVSFFRNDPNFPIWEGGWWAVSETAVGSGAAGHLQPDGATRLPTGWFGPVVQDPNYLLRGEPDAKSSSEPLSPDNFSFTSPQQKRLELDDRAGRERIVLADYNGNGLVVNSVNSAITLESFRGGNRLPSPVSLTLNPEDGGIKETTAKWSRTMVDDGSFEVSSTDGALLRVGATDAQVWTGGGHKIVLNDRLGRIEATTRNGRRIILDDLNDTVVVQGEGADQYLVIRDSIGLIEVYGRTLSFKAIDGIRMCTPKKVIIDAAEGIFLNSTSVEMERSFRGSDSVSKEITSKAVRKAYQYPYYDEKKA